MNKSKPFLLGLGIGLIVAGLVVQTSHWLTQAQELELPIPNVIQSEAPVASADPGESNPSPSSTPVDQVKLELQKQVDLLRKRTERLQNQLDSKPTVKVYIMAGTGSFTLSSILKRSGVIEKQGPFMDGYASLSGFTVKEGLYEFRNNMTAEEALFAVGAPIATPIPTVATAPTPSAP
jgi:hypothetical protein